MHTYASINHLLYNLGFVAFDGKDPNNQVLTPLCEVRDGYPFLRKPAVRKAVKPHNQTARAKRERIDWW